MKKVFRILSMLLALSCLLGTAALAETPVFLWEADRIADLYATDQLVVVYMKGQGYGVATPAGEIAINLEHYSLNDIECAPGFVISSIDSDDVHRQSLLSPTGAVLTVELYADINMFSEKWFAGFILKETAGDTVDYFGTDKDYLIERVDIYHIENGKVASLTRDQYYRVEAYGDYLLTLDRANNLQLHDSQFNPVESAFQYFGDDEFHVVSKGLTRGLFSRITGEQIATGYSKVDNVLHNGTRIVVYSEPTQGWGMIDREGNAVIPCQKGIDFYKMGDSRYVKFTENGTYGTFGLYDMETGKLVVPCAYNSFLSADYEHYNFYGYFAVEKDGKVGYVDENGTVTVDLAYNKDDVKVLGCTMLKESNGVYTIIAADGVVTTLDGITAVQTSGNYASLGRYLIVKNADGMWGIINWHGETVVDFTARYENYFNFIDATHFVYDSKFMYEIK